MARQEGALAMCNVDRLIVDRIILTVCDVIHRAPGAWTIGMGSCNGVWSLSFEGTTTEHFAYMQIVPSDFRAGSVAKNLWL